MKRRTVLLLFAVLAAAFIGTAIWKRKAAPLLQSETSQAPSVPARVALALGFRPGVAVDLAFLQAVERGDFTTNGFDVTLKPFGRADLIFAALNSGEIQGSLGVPLEPLLEQAGKGKYPCRGYLVWYFTADQNYDGLITRADAGVTNLDALRGKVVGSHPSKQVTHFVTSFLPSSTVRPYNPAAPLLSVDSGDMVAAYVLEPFLSIARTKPDKYAIVEMNSISRRIFNGERVPAALSVLSAEWIDAHPSDAARFVGLCRATYRGYANNRDTNAITKILTQPKFGSYAPEVATQVVEPASSLPEQLAPAQLQRFTTALKQGGLLTNDIRFDRLLYVPNGN